MGRCLLRRKGSDLLEEPAVNLTPLIDVVFVILIMFIVVAPLLELERVELAVGATEQAISVQETGAITIHVNQDNGIWLNKERVDVEGLALKLQQTKAQFPQARPQLFHDKRAFFGTYQQVKQAAERAGFTEMDVILKPA